MIKLTTKWRQVNAMSNVQPTEKRCTRCEVEKPITEFYGINRSHCKECERTEAAERMKRYGATFQGKASQALRTTQKAVKQLQAEGIEVTDTLTLIDVLMTLGQDTCAYCDNEIPESERTLDHVVPMRDGGGNTFDNITMACFSCNRAKNDLPLITYFMRENMENEQALAVFYRMAQRSGRTFGEIFAELSEQARNYYDRKTAEAIAKIADDGGKDEETS